MEFIIKILKWIIDLLIKSNQEPKRPDNSDTSLLWYPGAMIKDYGNKIRGSYPKKYPEGAVIHYTAGKYKTLLDAENTAKWMAKEGYGAFVIAGTGEIIQSVPLDSWCYHAGESYHETVGKGVSSKLVGIEVCCAGKVTKKDDKYFSWWGSEIPADEVVWSSHAETPGFYHKFTDAQEASLKELLMWLKSNNPNIFSFDKVFGHDELAIPKGRKQDPGGSIRIPVKVYRKALQVDYSK